MTTPAEQTLYSYVSTGIATYTIPMWIFQQGDISVFYNGAQQDIADYSVSSITDEDFSLTLSVPPLTGVEISVARDVIVTAPTDFSPGAPLTAADLNYKFDIDYIIENDTSYYGANIFAKYDIAELVDPTDPLTEQDLQLPKLSTPGPDESPRCWAKDSAGAIIDAPLDSSGISAAELKAELAVDTSAVGSGATLVGYYDASVGGTTVQAALDSLDSTTIARYTAAGPGKIIEANGAESDASGTPFDPWETPAAPESGFTNELDLGDAAADGSGKVLTYIGGTHITLNTAGTTTSVDYPEQQATWAQGCPSPTVAATGTDDTILATRGWVSENTSNFIEAASATAAQSASAADTNPKNFYFSYTP